MKPALHRRILTFLNAAILPSDLEFAKPLFIHDHEGLPIGGHAHGDSPARRERILDTAVTRRILALRDAENPLGFTHLRQLTTEILDAVLEPLQHHLGEHTYGEWASGPQAIPMRGLRTHEGVVHAALLRTGKVLFITADETTLVWDPEDVTAAAFQEPRNQPHSMPGGYSQLCGHHVFLSDGRLLSVGGGGYGSTPVARWGYKFDPIANTWERTSTPMSDSRWYPTAVALGDRRVLVACGHGTGEIDIYDESTDAFTHVDLNRKSFPPCTRPASPAKQHALLFANRLGHARACDVPFEDDDQSAFFTLTDRYAGSWTSIATAAANIADRTKGMSVLVLDSTRRRARVLVFGGANPSTNNSYEECDASSMSAGTTWSAPIPFPDGERRSLCSAVLLPGRQHLHQRRHPAIQLAVRHLDPRTNTWSRSAELGGARDYHSVSLLLPSGKVLMAGWDNSNIDIYSPPYLFNGPRPAIRTAPTIIGYGQRFTIEVPESQEIDRIVMVRPMAVTHQTDSEQRVIELSFFNPRMRGQRDTLSLVAPDGEGLHALAPPGYYMLFALNHSGVPSVAKWIRLASMVAKPGATVTALQPFEGHVDLFATTVDGTVMSTFFDPMAAGGRGLRFTPTSRWRPGRP